MKSSTRLANPCPGCGGPSQIRTSRAVTATFKTLYFACRDIECGCTFVGALELTHVISPSSRDKPKVTLPYRPSLRSQPLAIPQRVAQDIMIPANDHLAAPPASTGC